MSALRAQSPRPGHQLLERLLSGAADIADDDVLKRTLYGTLRPEEITLEQADQMVAAAERRVDRVRERLNQVNDLVEAGALARLEVVPFVEELDYRRRTLSLAESRARFLREIAAIAKVELAIEIPDDPPGLKPLQERFDGDGRFTPSMMRNVILAYELQFAKPIPISANGETAIHRAMGYDHRGRVDVALSPDDPEGVWLRHYLEQQRIPYYAFRAAIAGKATAPHIHIGPPSLPLRAAD